MPITNTAQINNNIVTQANVTATTYTELTGTTTAPSVNVLYSGNGVDGGNPAPNLIHVTPFVATGLTSGTCGFRLTGYRKYWQSGTSNFLYVPTVLASFQATLSTGTIPTFAPDGSTYNAFATITQNAGQPAALTFSPGSLSAASGEIGSAIVDACGCQIVTAQFIVPSGTYTMGLLWSSL